MKLSSVVLFAVLVAVVCADDENHHGKGKGEFRKFLKECMEKNGVDRDTMKESRGKADPDPKVKCVFSCVYENMGIMKPDGSPNQAGASASIAKMPEKMKSFKDNIAECMKSMKPGLAKCESGWLVAKCMKDKMPHHKGRGGKRHGKESDE